MESVRETAAKFRMIKSAQDAFSRSDEYLQARRSEGEGGEAKRE